MRKSLVLPVLLLSVLPVRADNEWAYAEIVRETVNDVIRPGYVRLADAAGRTQTAMTRLCETPAAPELAKARGAFAGLVEAWSGIELIRFGPVREQNRHERLNFWPDRKSLGLRQVQRVIANSDATATSIDTLRQKSVAVQGIGALEFVLHGTGSQALAAAGGDGVFRCAYGATIAQAIRMTSGELAAAWTGDRGYGAVMNKPGPDNPVYRTNAEAAQELLRSMTEELQFVRDVKLGAILGNSPRKARPRRAQFHRARLTVSAMKANLRSVGDMFDKGGFVKALSDDDAWLLPSIRFEIAQVSRNFDRLTTNFVDAVRLEEDRETLRLVIISVNSVGENIGGYYTERTGLAIGFNSLDGD